MRNQKLGAKKSSKGISLPLCKEKNNQSCGLKEIAEAARVLKINEMAFRKFLAENIFDSSGIPKEKFIQKGYFCIISKELLLLNDSITIEKVTISKKGLEFLRWFLKLKTLTQND